MPTEYPGNITSNVSKDAKYSVVSRPGGYEIRLLHRRNLTEKLLLTTAAHPGLVAMVNTEKIRESGAPGGAFYINEFRHVLVPAGGKCWFAGTYYEALVFNDDGASITSTAPPGLKPGDDWPGPRVGIRYKLKAGGRDISYSRMDGHLETEVFLSQFCSVAEAATLARRLAEIVGQSGGRIYLNEAREFFKPGIEGGPCKYLGSLGNDCWFPNPVSNL